MRNRGNGATTQRDSFQEGEKSQVTVVVPPLTSEDGYAALIVPDAEAHLQHNLKASRC